MTREEAEKFYMSNAGTEAREQVIKNLDQIPVAFDYIKNAPSAQFMVDNK